MKTIPTSKNNRLLAVDLGYSNVKVAYYNEDGVLSFDKYISAIAKVPDPLEPDNDILFQLGTDYYVIGSNALNVPRSYQLNLEKFEDLEAAYPVWINYLLEKYQNKDNPFEHVIIGLSLAFKDRTDELLKTLNESLMVDKPDYFICLPQGLSCKVAYQEFGLNLRNDTSKSNKKLLNFMIIDGGYLTIDVCTVLERKASAGAAIGIPNTGVINISIALRDYLYKQFGMTITLKEAQVIVDSGDGKFKKRGREYDVHAEVDEFTRQYLINILNLLEKNFPEELDSGIEKILIVGGLSHFFRKFLGDQKFVKEVEKHFPVSFLAIPEYDGEFYNVVSYLRIAENLLNKKQ